MMAARNAPGSQISVVWYQLRKRKEETHKHQCYTGGKMAVR